MSRRRGGHWPSLIVVACALYFTAIFLKSASKWWFEEGMSRFVLNF